MNVHFGALSVPARAVPDFDRAVAYLSRDAVERELFRRLEGGHRAVRLVTNARDDDSYDPHAHTIHWDPHSALRTTGGATQTPALGLGHEVDHAVHDAATCGTYDDRRDPQYDTVEERRVITGSERHAARTLGEGVRHDHAGTSYRVPSPVAMLLA